MGYLIASTALAYGMKVYAIDPHKGHEKGLYALIQPLTETELVEAINPFDTPAFLKSLSATLDRRLRGDESSARGILLVIDELARMAKMDCFEALVTFLERCTEETRKANITFIGGSPKWTARHFKGRADIRGCMNSALIHKCKPSQADLLLEDSKEKKLVEHLQRPGDAILVTDFAGTRQVSMPFCSRQDMETVAKMIGDRRESLALESGGLNQVNQTENQADSERQPKIRQIEKATGIPYSALQRYFAKGTPLQEAYKVRYEEYLLKQQHVESALKSIESEDESALNQTKVIQ
jgi:hypothetical protein